MNGLKHCTLVRLFFFKLTFQNNVITKFQVTDKIESFIKHLVL